MIWTALILGFAGSLHCIGMCSPLAMVVTNVSSKTVINRLLYNIGRILTYGALGALIASIGFAFPIARYQNLLSLIMGLALITIGLANVSAFRVPFVTKSLSKFSKMLKQIFTVFLNRKNFGSTFLLGVFNGFLPCGLSFLALTYCVVLSAPGDGFIFMLLFGVGTLPAMLGFTSLFQWVVKRFNFSAQRFTTSLFVLSGVLLIVRIFLIHVPHANTVGEKMLDIVICGR
jgi:sulfite exporter TauE/SafE